MRPVLSVLSDGHARTVNEVRNNVAEELQLSPEDLRELMPSGQKRRFYDRKSWALTYLKHAAAGSRPKRGIYQITSRGGALLEEHSERIDNAVLGQFHEFRNLLNPIRGGGARGAGI